MSKTGLKFRQRMCFSNGCLTEYYSRLEYLPRLDRDPWDTKLGPSYIIKARR